MFKVGQKVVFVDDSGLYGPCVTHPSLGHVYTVYAIGQHDAGPDNLCIVGCPNVVDGIDVGFLPSRFRPIDDLTAELAQAELSRVVEEKPEHLNIPEHA